MDFVFGIHVLKLVVIFEVMYTKSEQLRVFYIYYQKKCKRLMKRANLFTDLNNLKWFPIYAAFALNSGCVLVDLKFKTL